jgi:hypothetical protein
MSHPDGALPERIQTLTSMGYAIAHGDLEKVQAITKTLLQVAVGNRIPHRCECLDAFGEGAVRVSEDR